MEAVLIHPGARALPDSLCRDVADIAATEFKH
jgi:hypothetical protein